MKIILTIFFIMFTAAFTNQARSKEKPLPNRTEWDIEPSFKYDALCFLNILTADTFYLTYFKDEYEKFKPQLTPEVTRSLAELKRKVKDENGTIISAWLCLYFSAVEDSTLDMMIASIDNPAKLKENLQKTTYYDEDQWKLFESVAGELKTIFLFLKQIDFEGYWRKNILPIVEQKINEIKPGLPDYDVISENEHFLGFRLPSNLITVYVLNYVKPHGVKISGTRFLTDASWPFKIVLRVAVHEMMHPPYDFAKDNELREVIESLGKDEFLMDKVKNHNPSFGYNTLEGLVEEDCVQTLDQLINEKFSIATDARERWKASDDGIHVFAIALYQVMKEDNYNDGNIVFRDYLVRNINSGRLAAGMIKSYCDSFYSTK